jgi:hypothetical protein
MITVEAGDGNVLSDISLRPRSDMLEIGIEVIGLEGVLRLNVIIDRCDG